MVLLGAFVEKQQLLDIDQALEFLEVVFKARVGNRQNKKPSL